VDVDSDDIIKALEPLTTTTYMRTRKPMQGLNGVPSKPFDDVWLHSHCLTSFGCCGGKRVTTVIEAYIEGSPRFNMTGNAGNAVGNANRQDKTYN
jgi:hypothetical protein